MGQRADELATPTTAEELEGQLALAFEQRAEQQTPPTPPEPETLPTLPVETPPVETPPATPPAEPPPAEPPAPEPPEPPEMVTIGDVEMPLAEAQALVEFRQWAAVEQNRALLQQLGDVIEGRARIVASDSQPQPAPPAVPGAPATTPPAPSEDDLELLPQSVRDQLARIPNLEQRIAALAESTFEQQAAQHTSMIETAADNFAKQYGLDKDAVDKLQRDVLTLGILPHFVAQAGRDVIRGTQDALQVAYLRNPENIQREIDRRITASKDAKDRGRKASKLAGTSGSVPRSPETLDTPEARRAAMIEEIAQVQRGGSVE